MKLIYFKLENFKSIYNATGLYELEFNRENSDNRIILILGQNGSGKSSILDELTPIPLEHTNFRNKSRILNNKIGKKIIIYKMNSNLYYKLEIIYDKKTVCYFSESIDCNNWEELNKNGNVNTYLELLENYLGFSKNYVKVGYLSSAISNFIIMKPSERNEYISEWLPNIDIYLKAYKLVNQKYNQKKKEVDMMNKELGKINSIDYENLIITNRTNIKEISNKINLEMNKNLRLGIYLDKLGDLIPLFSKLNMYKNQIKENRIKVLTNKEELINLYKNNKDVLKYSNDEKMLEKLINETKLEIVKNNESYSNFIIRINKIKESISKKESNNILENTESLLEVENKIEFISSNIESLNKSLKEFINGDSDIIKEFDKISFDKAIVLEGLVNNIKYMLNNVCVYENGVNMDTLKIEILESRSKILDYENEIKEAENLIGDLDKKISLRNNSNDLSIIYNMKPESCSPNTCKLLSELLSIINDVDNNLIGFKENLIQKIDNLKKKIINENERIFEINSTILSLTKINDFIMINKNEIALLPSYILDYLNETDINIFKQNIDSILNNISSIKYYSSLKQKIESDKVELEKYEALKIKIINNNQLKEEYEELKILNNSVKSIEEKIKNLNIRLNNLNNIEVLKDKLNSAKLDFEESLKNHNESIEEIKNLSICYYWYQQIKTLKIESEMKIQSDIKLKERLEDEYSNLKAESANKTRLENIRNEGLKILNKYKILSNTWSPKIGYASWEIGAFLDILKDQTNKDLEEMWGSELQIESFNIDLNEFSIRINKNGNIIDDAILCSSGEQATLVSAISFAIIALNASSKMYNILRIDEVDAVLDSNKRRGFMDILIDRIEKMNCESCFVVTHNNEFDTISADVILMSEVNELNLDNKNIIYRR